MDYLSKISAFDYGDWTAGAVESPRTDVSYSGEDMQPYTPTGNGSGVFMDTSVQQSVFGGLSKVLDYALQRDAYKMQMDMRQQTAIPTTQQQVQVQAKQTNGMFLLLCGLGIYLIASNGGGK